MEGGRVMTYPDDLPSKLMIKSLFDQIPGFAELNTLDRVLFVTAAEAVLQRDCTEGVKLYTELRTRKLGIVWWLRAMEEELPDDHLLHQKCTEALNLTLVDFLVDEGICEQS
jgi:hypothetical protein